MTDFIITAHQESELSDIDRIRIQIAYEFYKERLSESLNIENYEVFCAYEAVKKADIFLNALGFVEDEESEE